MLPNQFLCSLSKFRIRPVSTKTVRCRSSYCPAQLLSLLACLLFLGSCGSQNRTLEKLPQNSTQVEDFDNSLTFNSVTLEEFDDQGRLWWKVKSKQAKYSKDKKVAKVEEPTGEFFQDGQSILKVSAKNGDVQQDGKTVFLRGDVVATDTRDGLVLRGNELEWQPRKDTLIVRNNLTGTHRQVKLTAKEGRFFSRSHRVEVEGQVTAIATDPKLQLKTERLIWLLKEQTLTSDRPLQIDRYVDQTPTARAVANQGLVSLKDKTITLMQNAQVNFAKPQLQLNSNNLLWNLNDQTLVSEQALTLVNREQQVTLNANQGRLELATDLVYLTGNVRGVGERNQARISSDRLNWNLTTEQFNAEGNVSYQQANPPLNLTGPRASGKLQDQTIVVSGGQVVTEFTP